MDYLTNVVNHIPDGTWLVIVAGSLVSILLQFIKKWLDLQSDKVVTLLLNVFSFIATSLHYIIAAGAANPLVLGQQTVLIVGISTILYRYIFKDATTYLAVKRDARKQKKLDKNITPPIEAAPVQEFQG